MDATSTATALQLSASAVMAHDGSAWFIDWTRPQAVQVNTIVTDEAAAEAIVALFPKSVGLKAGTIVGSDKGTGYVSFHAKLVKDGVNGEKNETGLKRLARLLAVAEKHGIQIEWTAPYSNAYPTREAFDAAI